MRIAIGFACCLAWSPSSIQAVETHNLCFEAMDATATNLPQAEVDALFPDRQDATITVKGAELFPPKAYLLCNCSVLSPKWVNFQIRSSDSHAIGEPLILHHVPTGLWVYEIHAPVADSVYLMSKTFTIDAAHSDIVFNVTSQHIHGSIANLTGAVNTAIHRGSMHTPFVVDPAGKAVIDVDMLGLDDDRPSWGFCPADIAKAAEQTGARHAPSIQCYIKPLSFANLTATAPNFSARTSWTVRLDTAKLDPAETNRLVYSELAATAADGSWCEVVSPHNGNEFTFYGLPRGAYTLSLLHEEVYGIRLADSSKPVNVDPASTVPFKAACIGRVSTKPPTSARKPSDF